VTRWTGNRLAKALAGIAIAGVAVAWAAGEVSHPHEMTLGDKHEVARMTEKMKTVCIGRFLVDMPQETRLELSNPSIDGFKLSAFDETTEQFQARAAARETEIKAKPGRLVGKSSLESVREVKTDGGLVGKIFVHSRTVTEGTAAKGLELERYHFENVAVEAMVHGGGISVDIGADKYDPDLVDKLPRLIAQLVPNPQNKIPAEPGFCIDRAYLRDPLHARQGERIMMFARLPSHPDVEFTLLLLAGTKPGEKGLLERNAESNGRLSAAEKLRVSQLRAARRIIGGLRGDEVVERFDEENDSIVYSFWWEVSGTAEDVMNPHLSFTMDTGKSNSGPVPSSLSQEAAIALWDKISSSIRLRPTEAPKAVAVEPPPTPLGTYALAGERCPESGWWLCGDGGNGIGVLGGQRQYIRKGERMPQALLLPPQTLWEKLRGMQPSYESNNQTAWKLVDKRNRKRVPSPVPLAPATPVAAAGIGGNGTGPRIMEEQGVAVGSFAATGVPCPASGWWRSEDPRALDGTRWFARGSLLPSATFALPPGAFGRSAHGTRSIERRGAWRLVRLADAPRQDAPGSDPAA
jgi:hypothetical protein